MNKDKLRELFGKQGDVIPELEGMFGEAYLNNPDLTKNDIPDEINGSGVFNVGPLLNNAIEQAPTISCTQNQQTIIRFFEEHVYNKGSVSHDEWFGVMKHMDTCVIEDCHELYDIVCLDIYLTPKEMREKYGEKFQNWETK